VWAIGTGLTCDPATAQKVHASCRSVLASMFSQGVADDVRIQYGGSVTPDTIDEIMAQPDIDGALVGGASLVAEKFERIMNFKV
jgi:triosephosphate isomerase